MTTKCVTGLECGKYFNHFVDDGHVIIYVGDETYDKVDCIVELVQQFADKCVWIALHGNNNNNANAFLAHLGRVKPRCSFFALEMHEYGHNQSLRGARGFDCVFIRSDPRSFIQPAKYDVDENALVLIAEHQPGEIHSIRQSGYPHTFGLGSSLINVRFELVNTYRAWMCFAVGVANRRSRSLFTGDGDGAITCKVFQILF